MAASVWTRLHNDNPLAQAWLFGLVVLLAVPALLFSRFMPGWAPPVAVMGLVVVFALRGLATGYRFTPVDGPLLVLLLMLPVGLWVSPDPAVTLPLTYAFIANLAIFWAVAAQRDSPWLAYSGWLLLAAGLVIGVIILLGTRFSAGKLSFLNGEIYALLPGRWQAFWDQESFNPNMSGGLLALFWLPTVILAWQGHSWQQRDTAKIIGLVLTGLLLLTQSRGAMLAGLTGLIVVTSLQHNRWRWLWAAVGPLLVGGLLYVGPETLFTTTALDGRSLQGRQELWHASFQLMLDAPLTGVGLGMVEPSLKAGYLGPVISPTGQFGHAHNIYLQAGAEMGLPGLVAMLLLYGSLFRLLLGRARHSLGAQPGLAWGLLGSLVVFLTHGAFDAIIASPQVALIVWALFGLMVAVASRRSRPT